MGKALGARRLYLGYVAVLAAALGASSIASRAQQQGAKVLSQPEFKLSDAAIAAGIDGVIGVSLTIDKTGKPKDVVIHGGPGYPCNSSPTGEIDKVREAVRTQLLATTFEPPLKDGKLKEADVWLQFVVGHAYKAAKKEAEAKSAAPSGIKLVDAGTINGRAIRLTKPVNRGMSGVVIVRALIDEDGNVAHAGVVTGPRQLQQSARDAACDSKFSPTVLHGEPVKVTGVITYTFVR